MSLTKRQKEVLNYLVSFLNKNGYSPSFEEIAHALKLTSLATVHKHLSTLEKKGFIRRGYNQSRSIEVVQLPKPVREQVLSIVEQLEELQVNAAQELGIDEQGVPFHVKKEVTSALRRMAPIGLSTDIIWTANVRTLRHVIEMRTAEGAEEELRLVFDQIAEMMQAEAPGLFQDFNRQQDGSWIPEHRKV